MVQDSSTQPFAEWPANILSIEPSPIAGKPGFITAVVKFANDGTNLYTHIDVKEGSQPDAKQDAANATKVTMMVSAANPARVRPART